MAAERSMAETEIQSPDSRVPSASKLNAQAAVFVPVRPNGSMQPVNMTSKNSPMVYVTPTQSSVVPVEIQLHHRLQLPHNQLYGPVLNYDGNYSPGPSPKPSNLLDLHGSNSKEQETKGKLPADSKDAVSASDGSAKRVLNQVEYYFSDLNLATTDLLMRFINKDPEGYVPISVVAAFKKVKIAVNNVFELVSILRTSSKLLISDDGNKVKRRLPITESDVEELQSRIVIAENLPEDHSFHNLIKIFSAVGRVVRNIRICPPQTSNVNSSASRSMKFDGIYFNNKLHAFVLYETVDMAEKAVAELNDEGNWRSGLQVRSMQKCMAKPNLVRGKKWQDGQGCVEEEEVSTSDKKKIEKLIDDDSPSCDAHSSEISGEEQGSNREGAQRKGHGRGRGKLRGRGQPYGSTTNEPAAVAKQPSGPRMPDGTRGFTMGRGKLLSGAN